LPDISSAPSLLNSDPKGLSSRLTRYNQRIKAIAEHHRIILVDVYEMSREALQAHPEFFAADGFHPSDAGYEYWSDLLWHTVGKVID